MGVVLDAEALSALGSKRPERRRRARAYLEEAERRDLEVVVPTAVLAELYRGNTADAGIDHVLAGRGIRVVTTGRRTARHAGRLRHRDRLDSCHVVDCLVVATAMTMGGGVILTADQHDLERLARGQANIAAVRV